MNDAKSIRFAFRRKIRPSSSNLSLVRSFQIFYLLKKVGFCRMILRQQRQRDFARQFFCLIYGEGIKEFFRLSRNDTFAFIFSVRFNVPRIWCFSNIENSTNNISREQILYKLHNTCLHIILAEISNSHKHMFCLTQDMFRQSK